MAQKYLFIAILCAKIKMSRVKKALVRSSELLISSRFQQHFHELLLHQFPFAKNLQTQSVTTEKLQKILVYEKAASIVN